MRTRSPLALLIGILVVCLPAVILACGGGEPADGGGPFESRQTEGAGPRDGGGEEGRGAAPREAAVSGDDGREDAGGAAGTEASAATGPGMVLAPLTDANSPSGGMAP